MTANRNYPRQSYTVSRSKQLDGGAIAPPRRVGASGPWLSTLSTDSHGRVEHPRLSAAGEEPLASGSSEPVLPRSPRALCWMAFRRRDGDRKEALTPIGCFWECEWPDVARGCPGNGALALLPMMPTRLAPRMSNT
jgi:hypothetical protein